MGLSRSPYNLILVILGVCIDDIVGEEILEAFTIINSYY